MSYSQNRIFIKSTDVVDTVKDEKIKKTKMHSLEHNAGIITGLTLVATGTIKYFIN